MANYSTNLKSWGANGQEFPDNYKYAQGEQPVDAWDNFFNHNTISDLTHLISLTNQRIESSVGTADPSSPEDGELIYRTDTEELKIYDSTNTTWRVVATADTSGHLQLTGDLLAADGEVIWDESATEIPDSAMGTIGSSVLASGSVTTAKLAADAVTGTELALDTNDDGLVDDYDESLLKDGGTRELDAADLAGSAGTSGQVLTTDGAAASWSDSSSSSSSVPSGVITIWSGSISNIPAGWVLCDGNNGTPNLQDRFVVGAGSTYSVDGTGGAASVALANSEMPSHDHGGTSSDGSHSHTVDSHDHGFTDTIVNKSSDILTNKDDTGLVQVFEGATSATNSASPGTDFDGYHSHSISTAGSDNSHENRPPYYALAYIMKT